MKIVITGASGFVGQRLVPPLAQGGVELVLVGRDIDALKQQFPGCAIITYGDIAERSKGADLLVHLAVRNNDQSGGLAEFEAANVTLLQEVVAAAKDAGIRRVLNVSSVQALECSDSPYAVSKRKAVTWLDGVEGIETRTLYLPLVHGKGFAGKLARLNRWPKPVIAVLFPVLAALKPVVHVDLIVAHILEGAEGGILSDGQSRNLAYQTLRTFLDWGFALTIIALFWWALLIVWALVKFTSPGPGLFVQKRVGRKGCSFKLYKFRTMAMGTKQAGTHEVSAASITPIGAFLRRTKLDELPQVVNILKGELSLIGPRPCLPLQEELVAERRARGVLDIRPGISGLAQTEGIDMSDPVRLAKRDSDYIGLQSILLDIKLILATATGSGRGDHVIE